VEWKNGPHEGPQENRRMTGIHAPVGMRGLPLSHPVWWVLTSCFLTEKTYVKCKPCAPWRGDAQKMCFCYLLLQGVFPSQNSKSSGCPFSLDPAFTGHLLHRVKPILGLP
jgi:hypothetical protein